MTHDAPDALFHMRLNENFRGVYATSALEGKVRQERQMRHASSARRVH